MSTKLKLQFDANQDYQLEAIASVVDLFQGLTPVKDHYGASLFPEDQTSLFEGDRQQITIFDNEINPNLTGGTDLDEHWLLDNLQEIQRRNQQKSTEENRGGTLDVSFSLEVDEGMVMEGTGNDSVRTPHFTVEMETGTGKTYVYFRTIHELHQQYGFTKFIIVVPSVAIFEGVRKTSEITESHFDTLYSNVPVAFISYDGASVSRIRDFASNQYLTIMVMTRDSFNKKSNNFFKVTEKLQGELKPYQYVQAARPIVILDEAQNFDTDSSNVAVRTLRPLVVLRYSATHRVTPNQVYQLTPVDAFRQNLVKQIEVVGISQLDNLNARSLRVVDIQRDPIRATLKAVLLKKGKAVEMDIIVRQKDNLFEKTGWDEYRNGYVVSDIKIKKEIEESYVEFENGVSVSFNTEVVGSRQEFFCAQIEKTIEKHMERQTLLKDQGIKVLSLFFIDKVKNYTSADGIIKQIFDESFEKLKVRFPHFAGFSAAEVRNGYFAKKKNKSGEEEAVDTAGNTQEDRKLEKAAFELIMKLKEQLLSFDEPVSFIFAHSALKEGWDNPNVFQICTLNETKSTMKKRQEIGRGLRLCVDQTGQRVADQDVNVLTVVANESYENYVAKLQVEYHEDGTLAPPPPKKPEEGTTLRNDKLYHSKEFREFWDKLNQRMSYSISVDTDSLIKSCLERLGECCKTPLISPLNP
ncbi:MAG: DEAD/DEAH box helicase family protein [Desulfobacteria bacterium]